MHLPWQVWKNARTPPSWNSCNDSFVTHIESENAKFDEHPLYIFVTFAAGGNFGGGGRGGPASRTWNIIHLVSQNLELDQ